MKHVPCFFALSCLVACSSGPGDEAVGVARSAQSNVGTVPLDQPGPVIDGSITQVPPVTILNPLFPPPVVPILHYINPSLIHARVDVSDRTLAGAPDRVSIVVSFRADLHGSGLEPGRFDPAITHVECANDGASVVLVQRGQSYVGELPRGHWIYRGALGQRMPDYYGCRLFTPDATFLIAYVPVVDPVQILAPTAGAMQFVDEPVTVSYDSGTFSSLWNENEPHFRFGHTDTITLTEVLADGSERVVARAARGASGASTPPPAEVATKPPYASPKNAGRVYASTRYEWSDGAYGSGDFVFDGWSSTSTAAPVAIDWTP
jgi:hypothetical protein